MKLDVREGDPPAVLLKTLSRLFYDPKSIVAIDLLIRLRMLSDEQLAERMLISVKDATKLTARLRASFLVQAEEWAEVDVDKPDARPFPKTYSFIDYPLAIDAIKLRLHQIRHELEQKIAQSHTGNMMQCPSCERTYTTLDASLNLVSNTFECSFCGIELVEHASANKDASEASDFYKQFMECTKSLLDILKKCDNWKIPTFDPKKWLIGQSRKRSGLMEENEEGEKAPGITVEIAEERVHTIPEWYTHSTLTGEQYILSGVKRKVEERVEEYNLPNLNHEVKEEEAYPIHEEKEALEGVERGEEVYVQGMSLFYPPSRWKSSPVKGYHTSRSGSHDSRGVHRLLRSIDWIINLNTHTLDLFFIKLA